ALRFAVDGGLPPLPELVRIGDSAFEGDGRELVETCQFSDVIGVAAFPIVDSIRAGIQTAYFLKAALRDTVYLHQKIEAAIWIDSLSSSHLSLLNQFQARQLVACRRLIEAPHRFGA